MMRIDQQELINSRLGVGFALLLGRAIPARIGYAMAYRIADFIATRRSWPLVQAVRTNQWVVSRGSLSGSELDRAVRDTFRNTAHAIYELNHFLNDPKAIRRLITFNQAAQQLISQSQSGEAGMVVVGVHVGNFDYGLRAVSTLGMRALVLTLTELKGGHQWQLHMRRNVGLDIQPANMNTLRQAIIRLQEGGVVMTGVDRPIGASKYRPRFFEQASVLPVHHIQLALKADVPIVMVAMIRGADNTYQFMVSEPIHMQLHPDRRTEIITNAEAVLKVAEDFICQAPQQWSISYPVWPELMDKVPQ